MNWENPTTKAVLKVLEVAGIPFMLDLFFFKKVYREGQKSAGVATSEDDGKAIYQATLAALRKKLLAEGLGQEPRIANVDAFMANEATAREGLFFRMALAHIPNEDDRVEVMRQLMLADEDGKKNQVRALARRPAIIKWVAEDIIGAYGRYMDTLRPPLLAATILELMTFTSSLKMGEHLQFRIAIGGIEDHAQRRAAIQEITALPQTQRLEMARARGYISSTSPMRATEDAITRLGGVLSALNTGAEGLAQRLRTHNDRDCTQQPYRGFWRTTARLLTGRI